MKSYITVRRGDGGEVGAFRAVRPAVREARREAKAGSGGKPRLEMTRASAARFCLDGLLVESSGRYAVVGAPELEVVLVGGGT